MRAPNQRCLTLLSVLLFALVAVLPAMAEDGGSNCSGVAELTLRYTGSDTAQVTVEQTVEGSGKALDLGLMADLFKGKLVIFDDEVAPGGEFTILGQDSAGTLGPVVRFRVDGKNDAKFRTNCSIELHPGMDDGDFEIVAGANGDGTPIGEGTPPDECEPGDDSCNDECEPGDDSCDEGPMDCDECDGQIDELTLIYHGEEATQVRVTQRDKNREIDIFDDLVKPGGTFTIEGENNRGTFGSRIVFYTDDDQAGRLHTSCSVEVGPGTWVRDIFEVVEGESRRGGRLCPVDGNGDGEPDCEDCDGQVSELTLRYLGDTQARVRVTQKDRGRWIKIYDELVDPDAPFTLEGGNKKGTFGSKIRLRVEDDLNAELHTSCSEEIGAGTTAGDFEVVGGESRRGGLLCPIGDGSGAP